MTEVKTVQCREQVSAAIKALTHANLIPSGLYGDTLTEVRAKAEQAILSGSDEEITTAAIHLVNAFDQANTNDMIVTHPEGPNAEATIHALRGTLNTDMQRTILTRQQYDA